MQIPVVMLPIKRLDSKGKSRKNSPRVIVFNSLLRFSFYSIFFTSLNKLSKIHAFSFPVLIVLLKVLLSQHGLDKPFTGGIGSYSLYVLLARHVSISNFEL